MTEELRTKEECFAHMSGCHVRDGSGICPNCKQAVGPAELPPSKKLDLLPCPFCGFAPDTGEFPYPINREKSEWAMGCSNPSCNAELIGYSCDEVIAQWNRRASNEPPAECAQCDELIGERDHAQDALQDTHIALGGDGEWVARSPSWAPPDSGDLHLDVPELARERMAELERLRAAQPPSPEPHVIKQIEHALQDNPAGITREMADYITGAIADYRHALTKPGEQA
jgi:hypothetical protein